MEKLIIELIKDLYTFHDFEISKEKASRISTLMIGIKTPKSEEQIEQFFLEIKSGKFGTFYKSPTCLTSMYWKEFKYNTNPFM